MRPLAVLLTAGAFLSAAAPAPAQQPPHLDFVRCRREKNYHDLALEYLDKLSRSPLPEVAGLPDLPLEMAKTRVDKARAESDPARRTPLFAQARADLDAFVKKNP